METQEGPPIKHNAVVTFFENHLRNRLPHGSDPLADEAWQIIEQDPIGRKIAMRVIERFNRAKNELAKSNARQALISTLEPVYDKLWETHTGQELINPPPQSQQEP